MGALEAIAFGCVGGALSEVYSIYQLRKRSKNQRPAWLKSPFYWFNTIVMILLGGGTVWLYLYSNAVLSPVIAIHLGAATPTLLGTLSKSAPVVDAAA
ncbi:hypothetical protein [Delftia tsuruhatensis]|jgi:polyferredoxin|uniref:Uncharacterized protein n=1 Tax=Delftia tsuruhatensis TaxID=180282 RepID=A0AAX3SGP3_9BURK|nr:hypothetical protein [Delftia tsuruhatensis]WFF79199.1 hypothetical protein PYR84_19920 [Delftia tsuruhatensis]